MESFHPELDFLQEQIKALKILYYESKNNSELEKILENKIIDYEKALFRLKNDLKKKSLI